MHHSSAEPVPVPFSASYWVDPGRFLAGRYPGDINRDQAEHKLSALLDSGIRCVVNLMFENEVNWEGHRFTPYEDMLACMAEERGESVTCARMSIVDMGIPERRFMVEVLDYIDNTLANGIPVYVHCWGGKGRTGTVVGCWLARHGVALGDEALAHLHYLRHKDTRAYVDSPQSPAQFEMVRSWREGE